MQLIVAVTALAALGGALPDNIRSLRRWGASNIMGRNAGNPLAGEQEAKEMPKYDVATTNGCYKSPGELKVKMTKIEYNSESACGERICGKEGFLVAGSMGGRDCYCGNTYPPEEDLVEDSKCNVPCSGFGENACGGIGFWTIYNTGVELLVEHAKGKESTSSSSSSTKTTSTTEDLPEKTVAPTEVASNEEDKEESGGGTNVAGIVAGVVVGVVVIAAALGGGFLFMRRKRNKEIEEEHRRNAAVNAFIGKAPGSSGGSITDARLDPVMAHRRMSDGSIADNQDYSRKILRVTNA